MIAVAAPTLLVCALNAAPVSVAYSMDGDTAHGGEVKEEDFIYRRLTIDLRESTAVIASDASGSMVSVTVPLQRQGKRAVLTVDQAALGLKRTEPVTLWSGDVTVRAPTFRLSAPIFDGAEGKTMTGFKYRAGTIANGFASYDCQPGTQQ